MAVRKKPQLANLRRAATGFSETVFRNAQGKALENTRKRFLVVPKSSVSGMLPKGTRDLESEYLIPVSLPKDRRKLVAKDAMWQRKQAEMFGGLPAGQRTVFGPTARQRKIWALREKLAAKKQAK